MVLKLIFSYFPILFLIFLMTKKNSMPSFKALPLVAFISYFIMLIVFQQDANLVHATVVKGLLVAWTPILIIAGAIFLFKTMEATGSLAVIRQWLNSVSDNKIAQLMIVGWAFPFLIEGASGFGTPAAIAAPILVGLGYPPVRVAILTLVMNSVPVSFGAVGTPTWFGFSGIELSVEETLSIGFKSALLNSIAAFIIPAIALMFIVERRSVLKNWLFILLSVLFTVLPYLLISRYNYEFPALVGGGIGLILTTVLAKLGIGLSKEEVKVHETVATSSLTKEGDEEASGNGLTGLSLFKATFPLWGTILILILTRIPQLGLKAMLTYDADAWGLSLGSLGDISLSPALVIGLKNIFGTAVSWSHKILYVPSILPFFLISLITFGIYRKSKLITNVFGETVTQMVNPTKALLAALVFVGLMMMGGKTSSVSLIGQNLADITGSSWNFFAAFLGAIGSFFSGSNTISNLTFGGIQDAIALKLGLERTTVLALQSVGGAMGNMVCINNIVAVASVLALDNIEGFILKRTVRAMLVYGILVGIFAALLF